MVTTTATQLPVAPGAPAHRRVRSPWKHVTLLALLAALVGLCVPLAPVRTDDPTVSWPRAGAPVQNTLVPLVPYRPRALTVDVPCSAVQALAARGGGELLRTRDAAGAPSSPGLVIGVQAGRIRVTTGDVTLFEGTIRDTPCSFRLQADDSGMAVLAGGALLVRDPDLLPPQIEKLQTDLAGSSAAQGLQVTIRPDARFNSSPSVLKLALLALEVVLLVALLATAWRRWPGRQHADVHRRAARPRRRHPHLHLHPADYAVVLISAAWMFLGPMNIDDGWYLEMALAGRHTGYIGNTVGQYSVGENPFVLHQYLMQAWLHGGQGWSLLWMRLLVALLGLATYALLRQAMRLLLGPAGERPGFSRRVPWLLALAHLSWWLPYGLTLRPEPVIVLGSAATLVLAETARRRLSLGVLTVALAVAAITTTASPSGLVAWAPVLVQVRWAGRCFLGIPLRERIAAALVLLAAPSAAIPIAFGDASLGTVLTTHTTQRQFYPDLRWYDEILHVAALFEPGDVASWGRRLPVLLTFACVGLAVTGTRGARADPRAGQGRARPTVEQAMLRVSVMVGIGVAVLALSPTKWVNHYGALAGLGTPALALVMLRFPLFGGRWSTTARLGGALIVALGLAASFAGPNMWRPITDWGQPFGKRPIPFLDRTAIRPYTPHLGPFYASTLVLWLLVAAVIFAVVWRRRGSRRLAGAVTGSALLTFGLFFGVVLMGVVFVIAPVRQSPAWSAAASDWRAATGTDCGLADAVEVDLDGTGHFVVAREALAGQTVFVDVKVRPVWPCEGSTTATDGLTELPRYRILAGEGLAGDTDVIYRSAQRGGVQTVLDREARIVDLPTRQVPTGPGQTLFGVIQRVDYTMPTAGYDLRPGHRQVAGWTVGHPLVPPDVERWSEATKSPRQRAAEQNRP